MSTYKKFIIAVLFTVASFVAQTGHAQAFLSNGLISYFPFSGNANDVAGTNNGILSGASLTSDRFGVASNAYLFSTQSNSVINVPNSTLNNLTNGTIAVWVSLNINTNEFIFAKQHTLINTYGVLSVGDYCRFDGGLVVGSPGTVYFHAANYAPLIASSTSLTNGPWYLVVVTFSPTNCFLYINGSISATASGNFSIPDDLSATATTIGAWQTQPNGYFDGKIDDVRIYNRQLSSNEVAQMYATTASNYVHVAMASAVETNGFVISINVLDSGYGYTNTPVVHFLSGAGSGTQASAVVSNGVVVAVNMVNAGSGYTNAPVVFIDPPFVYSPALGIAPMTFLAFSNLTVGGSYQLQRLNSWYWTNLPISFVASNSVYTNLLPGVAGSVTYRLALNPVPAQAFATPQIVNGFIVGANITSGGSGYVVAPGVRIVGGGGINATASSQITGGVVTKINITDAGTGYTNTPTIQIDQPPVASLSPQVLSVMRIDSSNLIPYYNYKIQFTPAIGGTWTDWNGSLFTATATTNSEYIFITNGVGFFQSVYVP